MTCARSSARGCWPQREGCPVTKAELEHRLREMTKARDSLAALASTLADGDFPPSSVECHFLIRVLRSVGK